MVILSQKAVSAGTKSLYLICLHLQIFFHQTLHPNDHVNLSQSTNDSYPSSIKVAAYTKLTDLLTAMEDLKANLLKKSVEFKDILKMGRTELEDAVPTTLGNTFEAFATYIDTSIHQISHARETMKFLNMGATAIGTGINCHPDYKHVIEKELHNITGINYQIADNLIAATQDTADFVYVSGALKTLAVRLSKIANDLRLMNSGPRCGLGEINLPKMQPGSSIMPGKVNPVIAEVLNQTCYQIIGNDTAICLAVENGQFELNVMEPVIAFNIFNSLKYMTNAVNTFVDNLLIDLEANKEQCYTWLNHSVGTITALLPHIGYENASMIAKEAYQTNKPVREIILSKNLLTEEELDIILSPSEMTRPGIAGDKLLKENLQKRA